MTPSRPETYDGQMRRGAYLGHVLTANGALGLLAEDPHAGGTLVADGMVAGANRVQVDLFEANDTGVFVAADRRHAPPRLRRRCRAGRRRAGRRSAHRGQIVRQHDGQSR